MNIKRLIKLKFCFPFIKNSIGVLTLISMILGNIIFYTKILPTAPPNYDFMDYYTGLVNTMFIFIIPLILPLILLEYYIDKEIEKLPLTISYKDKTILLTILFHFIYNQKNKQSKYSTKLTLEK